MSQNRLMSNELRADILVYSLRYVYKDTYKIIYLFSNLKRNLDFVLYILIYF